MAKYGREPDHLKILPGLSVIVGKTDAEARADFEYLQSLIHPMVGREILSTMLGGMDLSRYPLDQPLPDPLPPTTGSKGHYESIVAMARREKLTIRELGAPSRFHDQLAQHLAAFQELMRAPGLSKRKALEDGRPNAVFREQLNQLLRGAFAPLGHAVQGVHGERAEREAALRRPFHGIEDAGSGRSLEKAVEHQRAEGRKAIEVRFGAFAAERVEHQV